MVSKVTSGFTLDFHGCKGDSLLSKHITTLIYIEQVQDNTSKDQHIQSKVNTNLIKSIRIVSRSFETFLETTWGNSGRASWQPFPTLHWNYAVLLSA